MNHRPQVARSVPEVELPAALERALAEVRARAQEYRRWWSRQHAGCGVGGAVGPGSADAAPAPWSDRDEERAARLAAIDPWWMRSVAEELERAHSDLRDIGTDLTRIAGSTIGASAAARCAQLAATSHDRASEAATLAAGARAAGDHGESLLDDLARRLTEIGHRDFSHRDSSHRDLSRSDFSHRDDYGYDRDHDREEHRYFAGYAEILRAVRAELDSAIEHLPALVGSHPSGRDHVSGWSAGPDTWTPEPGTGPRLPGLDVRRVETDTGVRIARLPDGPVR